MKRSQAEESTRIATNILLHPGQPLNSKPRKDDGAKGKDAKKPVRITERMCLFLIVNICYNIMLISINKQFS